MENFNEYWELFVDKKDSIAKEIIAYYKTLDDHEDGTDLSDECRAFFKKNMLHNPYPTCQVLKLLAMSTISAKNSNIYEIATAAVLDAFSGDQHVENSKLYNMLANGLISVKATNRLKSRIMKALESKRVDLEMLLLAMFSRKSVKLLVNLLPEMVVPLKQQWAWNVLDKKQHFLTGLLQEDHSTTVSATHANYIRFMKQVLLANSEAGSFSSSIDAVDPLSGEKGYLNAYILELQRCFMLQSLPIDKTLLPARDFSQHSTVLSMLVRANANLMEVDFSTLLATIRSNQMLIEQIVPTENAPPNENTETMKLLQIQAIILVFKAIKAAVSSQGSSVISLDSQLKGLLKETDMKTFLRTMELIFTMLFMRGDMLPSGSSMHAEQRYFLCSLAMLGAITSSMKSIMITRKHSAGYQDASANLKQRFRTLLEFVTDVCWRLSLFDETPPSTEDATPIGPKCSRPIHLTDMPMIPTSLTRLTEHGCESSSSGGGVLFRSAESVAAIDTASVHRHRYGNYGTLPKHKPTRRHNRNHPVTGSSNSGGSSKDLHRQQSLPVGTKVELICDRPEAAMGDITTSSGSRTELWNKKAFTKLFASPETLAIVCLTNSKMHFARQIIEDHNLYDRPVGRLIQRIEQTQALKSNLVALIKKQESTEGSSRDAQPNDSSSDVLLNDIRHKTAVGFEISKVLSTIETFLKSQTLDQTITPPTDGVLPPMDRFVGRYPFLSVHTGKNLHLSQIVDIVLNLPFTYELNLALYNFLLKNAHHMVSTVTGTLSTSTSGYGGELSNLVGNYVSFFGTVIDTLQLAHKTTRSGSNTTDRKLTIGHLLSREVCPLDAVENGVVLKRRARFHAMVERGKDVENASELETALTTLPDCAFASLSKMKAYVGHLVELMRAVQSIPPSEGGHSAHEDISKGPELIRTDVQELMVKYLCEKEVSLATMDTLARKIGVNLLQTLGRKLLGWDASNELCKVDGLMEFLANKNELLCQLCRIQSGALLVTPANESVLANYMNLKIGAGILKGMPICCRKQRPAMVEPTELFFQECNHSCCLLELGTKESSTISEVLGSVFGNGSLQEKASMLLANVDIFVNASEWISASEHLLTAIQDSDGSSSIEPDTRHELQQKANQLRTYVRIGELLQLRSRNNTAEGDGWQDARKFSDNNKSTVLHHVIELGEYRLCADWIQMHPIDAEKELEMFMCAVHKVVARTGPMKELQAGDTAMTQLFDIIETMSTDAVVKLYEAMMLNVRSVPVVSYMLAYLQQHATRKPLYQKYEISLKIFEHLSREEYDGLWNLASRPLLIIEQCLMNSRLELLSGIIRSIRPSLVSELCKHCYEHREYIRDLHDSVHGGMGERSAVVIAITRTNPVHDGLFISDECVDCLLRVYAGKALEYKVFPEVTPPDGLGDGSGRPVGPGSRVSSFDSLSEVGNPFVMPKEIPSRDRWVKDEDAQHCMCCRRTFSMLNRRHHCRRCGRIACHACSKRKIRLGHFYEDVAVRVCDDCWRCLADTQPHDEMGREPGYGSTTAGAASRTSDTDNQFEWLLTGNERYDNVIRDEYTYEYAPSTGQCLAICNLHTPNEELASFLLYHCAKLEALLRPLHPGFPNPEIDYALVARMLLNLTLGVKVRGGGAEVEKMKEHAEIILSIVHDNCESLLLHTPSMSNHSSLRRLRDALVKAEKWTLALELSLKCGFSLTGVMAAWGMTCLRAGCYEMAREKYSHCLPRIATELECDAVLRLIETTPSAFGGKAPPKVTIVKRPARCPPLLNEILYALTVTARLGTPSERVVARVNAARQASGSAHEPALNILSTLANLRNVCQGEFEADSFERIVSFDSSTVMCSRLFEESMHYLLAYGSHQSIVQFLMRYRQTEVAALRYVLAQHVEPDVFLQAVLIPYLQRGELETIVQRLSDIDDTLLEWREYIRYTCRFLETNDMLNSLYNLQLLLKDPIRASMTCVRFYTTGGRTFTDLHAAEHHLKTSITHLQNELELCNWQEVRLNSAGSAVETHHSLLMKLDPKELNNHINTILLQLDVTKFLATCEAKGRQTTSLLSKIFREASQLPTLFGSAHEKLQLAILTLVCGQNVEEAFGLSYRIIQDYNLDMQRVYALTAKYFINHGKIEDVSKLLDAIVSNESSTGVVTEPAVSAICDEIVRVSVDVAIGRHGTGVHTKVALEALISRANSVAVRVHCYIASGQLKTAYLLANRHQRTGDIRKILRQAELLGQMHVKRLCEARLNHHEQASGTNRTSDG
ncbi:zinc finger FYVE domain-containing protein 26 homolog [Anopheles nili]|uniref:zinc finger FYVE domain-containing protein 26 homolog n=1 Tax=Anopheles nili TaxID=185578 RepID=UPI00237B22A2|nr:zinc finger FYVE domain-containing protein 26 homolog [Anopheles nili]